MASLVTLERWKVILAVVLSLLVGSAVGFLVERSRVHTNPVATTTPTVSAEPTATPVATDSATPAPTSTPAPTATPTAAPSASPTLAPPPPIGNGSAVFTQAGTGDGGRYTLPALSDNWGFAYSFLCNGNGQFNVTPLSGGATSSADPPFAAIGSNVQGVQQYAKGGSGLQVQIHISGSCQWKFSVYNGNG